MLPTQGWKDKPDCPGAYWSKSNKTGIMSIFLITQEEDRLFLSIPGKEGRGPVDEFPGGLFTFYGPIMPPDNKACHIYYSGHYKETDAPVEPKDEQNVKP